MADFEDIIGQAELDRYLTSAEVKAAKVATAEEAAAYWRAVETGKYVPDVKVIVSGDKVKVGDQRDIANLIEYGDGHNDEYAPRAKTEAHFNRPGIGGVVDEIEHL